MKKIIFMLISIIVMGTSVMNAQSQVCQTIADGWFGGVNVGTNAPIKHSFGFAEGTWNSEWRFTFGGEIGRNITPVTSLSFSDEMFVNIPISTPHFNTAFDKNTMYANVGFNLTNFFLGYKGTPRMFEVRIIPGIGWSHYFEPINLDGIHKNFVTYRLMSSLDWNIGKNKAWQINFKPAITCYNRLHASTCDVEFRVGTTYKFNGFKTNSHNIVLSDKTRTEAEYLKLLDDYNTLKNTPAQTQIVEKIVEKTNVLNVAVPNLITTYFEKGSAELSETAKSMLNTIPNGSKVTIDGYASIDGEKEFNKTLSVQRATVVANYLKTNGVEVISAVGNGVASPDFDRVSIVTIK